MMTPEHGSELNSNTGDEGKPRCRNCINRNLQCQYGSQLTFLTKNFQTVQPSEIEGAPVSYESIRVGYGRILLQCRLLIEP